MSTKTPPNLEKGRRAMTDTEVNDLQKKLEEETKKAFNAVVR